MSHVCDIKGLELKTLETTLYTCGECDTKFTSICTLHQHVTRHNEGGFYFFDDVIKVAFPKSGTVCTATQTDLVLTNFIQQLKLAQKLAHISGGNLNVEESDEKILSYDANCDITDTKAFQENSVDHQVIKDGAGGAHLLEKNKDKNRRGKFDRKSGRPAVSKRTNRKDKTSNDSELPSKYSSKALGDDDDDDDDDDGISRQSVESVHHEPHLNTERNQTITVLNFKTPLKVSEYRKTRMKNMSPVLRTKSTRLVHNEEQNEEFLITGIAENSEIRFSNQTESEANKNLTDRKTYVTHDRKEDFNTLNEKDFFYGKISSVDFEIQRVRPKGVFSQGEKNEHNKVSVSETWTPVSEWTLDTTDPAHQVNTDEIEVSKKGELTTNVHSETKEELNIHETKWEYNQKPSFVCNVCGKSFRYRRHFDGHMNKHLGVRPYMCQYCGKSYHKLMTLQAHQLHVHSDRNAWLTCKICGVRKFPTAARLRVHEETHNADFRHICRKCNKSYKSIKLLKAHDKYVHCKKQFPCKNCKLSFASEEEYKLHQKARHNEVNNCRFCGRVFSSLQSKAGHEKIHLGVKPHKCHICHRRFLQKTPFWVHMEKHHDLTKAKLIQLFPEKHLNKNKQHLLKKIQPKDELESTYKGIVNVQIEGNS